MTADGSDRAYCRAMLPKVSRTFAACINLLPPPLDHHVLVAYLLCRIADTIEDAPALTADEKRRLLAHFRSQLDEGGPDSDTLQQAFSAGTTDDEQLTRDAQRTLREFRDFPSNVRAAIRPWVQEMCAGMAGFAAMQPHPDRFQALEQVDDLDRYCWYVAGTVGHMLTDLFRIHSPRITQPRYQRLKAHATDFGLGLQLVNIIKDVADDRRRGWSFVPRQLCLNNGVDPEHLLDPANANASRQALGALIAKARGHLDRALDYCTELPRTEYRMRRFCLTPLYFAIRTLALAQRDQRLLDPAHKVKISRREVYRTMGVSGLIAPSNLLVRNYYRQLASA
ncbi:MAG: phytoene/squalene synthase family protein [Planctomycetota bacterium]